MTTQPPRDTVEPDMSWIDIAVCRNATVIVRFSPGWAEFIDEFHFEDVFECDVPDLGAGLYRWTGYKIGFWGEDDHINLKGGTFTPYALTTQSPSSEYARGIEDAAKVADDYAHEREGSWSGDAAEEVAAAIRALTPAQPQERVVPAEWQKPYADAGHDLASLFSAPGHKCKLCGAYQIDLSEDLVYGDMRKCVAAQPQEGALDDGWQREAERQEQLAKTYRQAQLTLQEKLCREEANVAGWKKRAEYLEQEVARLLAAAPKEAK